MKKLLALALAATMALSLAACGGAKEEPAAPSEPATEAPAAETYKVGICQLAPHPALDAATQGFIDALNEALPGQVEFDNQNAAGESATCATIVNGFVSADVDLIMANATPALQAAVAATSDIPVLGTSVTEYGVALGIDNFSGTVGTNVSGTSDLAPLDEQAAMVKEWFPEAKTVGLLYCSAEANSQYQVDTVQAELEKLGLTCTQYPFSDTNDMASVTQSAIDNIARPAGVPIIAGEEGICGGCGVATLSISYYDLGVATGKMAAKILTGEADIAEMPIEYAPQFTKKYNETICTDLGLTVPEGYEAIA